LARNKLTPKQKRFVDEYLIDLNATQAAVRAGYSKKTAYSTGQRLLKKVEVQEMVQKRNLDRERRTEITQDRVLQELASIGFAKGTDYASIDSTGRVALKSTDSLTTQQKAAVISIKETQSGVEVKIADKVKALELLGKHLGLFDSGASSQSAEDRLVDYLKALEGAVRNGD
jgi:phage terminase small subunit